MPGGSKRKRKNPPDSPSTKGDGKPAARKNLGGSGDTSFLMKLMETVRALEKEVVISSAGALLLNNKAWALEDLSTRKEETPLTKEQAYCFALILVTHVLHRITTAIAEREKVNDEETAVSKVLAGWARFLMTRMDQAVPSYSKWDKATGPTRHFLARMITTITGASLASLTAAETDTVSLLAATATLEESLLQCTALTRPPAFGHGEEFTTDAVDAETFTFTENPSKIAESFVRAMSLLRDTVKVPEGSDASPFFDAFLEANAQSDICEWSEVEWAFLRCLDVTGATGDTKTTRKRGSRLQDESTAGTNWSGHWESFCKENPVSQIPFDCRLAARRWGAIMMDWYLQASPRMLVKAQMLLGKDEGLDDIFNQDGWTIPGKVLPVLFVGRWGRILAESSNRSGYRPPSMGAFDAYVKPLVPMGLRVNGKPSKKTLNPDVRDVAMVTIHSLLEAHAKCLDPVITNGIPYCLWVPDIIRDLATAASGALSGSDSTECIDRLEHAAAAYIPTLFDGTNQDWILRFFGLSKLFQALNAAQKELPTPTLFESGMVEAHGTLPTPSTHLSKPASKKKKTETSKQWCAYAGVYPRADAVMGLFEKIALHLRGYGIPSKPKQSKNSTTVGQGLGENCIRHWFTLAEQALMVPEHPPPVAQKGKRRLAATQRPSKRRRNDTNEKIATAKPSTKPKKEQMKAMSSVLSAVRARVISKILQILDSFVMARTNAILRDLLPSINEFMLPVGASLMLKLNLTAYNVLFLGRSFKSISPPLMTEGDSIPSKITAIPSHESELWANLVSMNATLATGRLENMSMEPQGETILGASRLELYKLVAAAMPKKFSRESWPLWIPTPFRVFVSCNLCAEAIVGDQVGGAADQFIVSAFLDSLNEALLHLDALVVGLGEDSMICLEEEIPLSLLDARLIVGACARLPDLEQFGFLDKLLDCVNKNLRGVIANTELLKDRGVSSFLARVLTTVSHVATLVGCSSDYCSHIQGSLCDSFARRLNAWEARDKHVPHMIFMGILENWESTDLPDGVNAKETLPGSLFPKLHEMIDTCFNLGFESISSDSGHLLYSAWNAHGKSSLWNPVKDQLAISTISLDRPTSAILAIRNDLCLVHRRIRSDQGVLAKSSISKSLDRNLGAGSPRTIVNNLKILIEKGSENINKFLNANGNCDETPISTTACAVLQSLCICVSFGISMLSVTDSSFFHDLMNKQVQLHRPRGYSTDSDNVAGSDVDSTISNDARMNTAERLAEVCRAIGCVPAHPDWLDSTCSLRYSVTRAEARGLATSALRAMTRLVEAAVKERSKYIRLVLEGKNRQASSSNFFLESTSLLHNLSGSLDSVEYEGALKGIALFCSIELETAEALVNGLTMSLRTATSDFWCTNASQLIIGEMQCLVQAQLILPSEIGSSELRGTGEWEIAQAISLLAGVFDAEDQVDNKVLMSSRWTSLVMSTLEWMVPACALLRFSLQAGGTIHPLKSLTFSVEDYLFQAENTVEGLSTSTRLSGPQRDSVLEAVGILSSPVTSKERASRALACHLIGTERESRNLARVGKVVPAIRVLMKVLDGRARSEKDKSMLKRVVSSVMACLKSVDDFATDWPLTRLLVACSGRANLEINSLALGKLKITDIIISEAQNWNQDGSYSDFDLSNFVFESISALSGLLRQPAMLTHGGVQYVAAVLASLSTVERRNGITLKLNDFLVRSISESPGSFFQADVLLADGLHENRRLLHDLSNICSAPFFAQNPADLTLFATELSEILFQVVSRWKDGRVPQGILNLWFLCGTHTLKLEDIGDTLASEIIEPDQMSAVHNFTTFISCLASALTNISAVKGSSPSDESAKRRLCSFVIREGFQEQHWYNCRTCGLTGEKGCCSNCARLCHNGHDVCYARFSSFFCDCGAESAKSRSDSPTQECKCLAPAGDDDLILPETKPNTFWEEPFDVSQASACAYIAASSFRDKSQKALKRVRSTLTKNHWVPQILEAVTGAVHQWKSCKLFSEDYRSVLSMKVEAPVSNCTKLDEFDVIHSSRQGSFDVMSMNEESRSSRCLMAADSRGRVVVCEGSKMRFFPIASMIHNSFATNCMDFENSDIPFLSSTLHDMKEVKGLRLSIYNECHLLLWSKRQVCAFVVRPAWDGVLKRVQLPLRDEPLTESITKCEWLSGIDGFVCVGMKDCFQIYRLTESGPSAILELSLTSSSSTRIKDFVIVPRFKGYTVFAWKIYFLLERGELHQVEFERDYLLDEGTAELFVGDTGRVAIPHSQEGDIGERVDYLEHCGLVLCQTSKAGVIALHLENGQMKNAIHLLPTGPIKTLDPSKEFIGPYENWHSVKKPGNGKVSPSLSLFCTARINGSAESILLQLDIRESLSLKASVPFKGALIEGSVAFALPTVHNDRNPFDISGARGLSERLVLSILTSSGILSSLIETKPGDEILSTPKQRQPVLVFEKLHKARLECLSFRVDGVSDDIGSKLQRDNDEFFISPRPEGFVLNISIKPSGGRDEGSLVIAALRIQVGRISASGIPSRLFVEGRKIPLKKDICDWYAIVLTAQEVVLVMRKGFVTLKVDTGHISANAPVLDSVEVYGLPRSAISKWLNPNKQFQSEAEEQNLECLVLGVESLRNILSVGNEKNKSSLDKELLRSIVYETAIGCTEKVNKSLVSLVTTCEGNIEESRQAFLDGPRVKAYYDFVKQSPPEGRISVGEDNFVQGERFISRLEDCLRLSCDIAKNRPQGYLKAMAKDGNLVSVALPASVLLENDELRSIATDGVVTQLTELCLIEMAIAGGSAMQGKKLDYFAALQRLLQCQTGRILAATCRSVQNFCKRFRSSELLGEEPDPFAAQTMAAFYGCDSCSLFPIEGTRYTLENDHHSFDLCEKCYRLASNFASSNKFRHGRDVLVEGKTVGDDSAKLDCGQVRNMEAIPEQKADARVAHRQQVYEDFLGNLFLSIVGLFSDEVESKGYVETDFIQLATDLVNLSEKACRTERKKRLAKKVVDGLAALVALPDGGWRQRKSIVACLNTLSQLIVPDNEARPFFSSSHTSSLESSQVKKGDADALCEVHQTGIELRKFREKGKDGKQFVVCKSDRCVFFAWVRDNLKEAAGNLQCLYDNEAARTIWEYLTMKSDGRSLLDNLREIVEGDVVDDRDLPSRDTFRFFPYAYENAIEDVADGVVSGMNRTRNMSVAQYIQRIQTLPKDDEKLQLSSNLIEVSLELLSLTAPVKISSLSQWHHMLCKMIASDGVPKRKSLAKTTLFRLCGADYDSYHRIVDHFALSSQFRNLTEYSDCLLKQALILREKAHVCGQNWRVERVFSLSNTNGLDFLGIRELLHEGALPTRDSQAIRLSLDEALVIAKRRSKNWQSFSRMSVEKLSEAKLKVSPLALVLSLSLLLNGDPQLKAMKLCELAFPPIYSQKKSRSHDPELIEFPFGDLSHGDALVAFSNEIVLKSRRAELRRIACGIANQIARHISDEEVRKAFPKLIIVLEKAVVEQGKNAVEFISLLTSITQVLQGDPNLAEYGMTIQACFLQQMYTLHHHRENEDFLVCEARSNVTQRKRFDLGFCVHCSRSHPSTSSKRAETTERQHRSGTGRPNESTARRTTRSGSHGDSLPTKPDWIDGQVSAFSRSRLSSLRESHSSNEFATYIELKNRFVISEVHLEIHDPRGRFVKTITVYWSPRPANNIRELMSESYATKWEEFGTMQLARGVSRASIIVTNPVVVANIKIEYTDFYERPGDCRQPDNGFVVHCPRCSRIVQNAHGVCGNCGEVAFQCRKCRHINYDRLDAFLCVECGYCASGTFHFEIMAATATNAVAITNDVEYDKAQKMLAACTRIREDMLFLLKNRYAALVKVSKRTEKDKDDQWGSKDLRRVYNGQAPAVPWQNNEEISFTLESLGGQGAVVRAVARPHNLDIANRGSTDRRSTLNALSRSGSSSRSSRSEDIAVQQIRAEIDEDESEILGLLEGSGRTAALDSSDPISRLLARVRGRHDQSENDPQDGGLRATGAAAANAAPGKPKSATAKDHLEVCERLHMLMREAEREAFELQRRISAWEQLNRDDLAGLEAIGESAGFLPCRCWNCSCSVASVLLSFWAHIFRADPSMVAPSSEIVEALLQNESASSAPSSRSLQDCKRSTIESIATCSTTGAQIVLSGLRKRFSVGQDVYAAELLGRILESSTPSPLRSEFVDLAATQLERYQVYSFPM